MKKLILSLFAGAALAHAADYQEVYMQAPADAPSVIADKKLPFKYSVDLMEGIGFKSHSSPYAKSILSTEIELARYLSPRHAFTCALSYSFSHYDNDGYGPLGKHYTDGYDRDLTALMVGYRFTQKINNYFALSLGAKGGPELNSLNVDYGRDLREGSNFHIPHGMWEHGNTHTRFGLGYAAYANICFILAEGRGSFNIGYQFRGTTTAPDAERGFGADACTIRTNPLQWHEVRVGFTLRY